MWYLAVVDGAVGYGGERLAWSSWRRTRRNQVCRDMLASARRDLHVGSIANVNSDVVLVIAGM